MSTSRPSRPLSSYQSAVLNFITETHEHTRVPVTRADVDRNAGVPRQYVTSTLASLIDRQAIHVPVVGVAAYLPGGPARFSPAEVEAAILLAWPVDRSLSPAEFAARVRRQLEGRPTCECRTRTPAGMLLAPGCHLEGCPEAAPLAHEWVGDRCGSCRLFQHKATESHPEFPGAMLYSLDGEHWTPHGFPCDPRRSNSATAGEVTT